MNLLIVGAGGREHALCWKCKQSSHVDSLFVTPGNGGIEEIAECWYLTDHQEILKKAKAEKVDLVIIGQEDYLVDGITELLENVNIPVFGPSQAAAKLEGSKEFSKNFMEKYDIPTAGFEVFSEAQPAKAYLKETNAPYVLKASGLAAGKGVLICKDYEEASRGIDQIMVEKAFGDAGNQVVIEEFMEGEEVSWFIFTDGENYTSMPTLQDHKRQLELDLGPNTGGMGCYSPAPIVTSEVEKKIIAEIVEPTLKGMKNEGHPFLGVLYIGLMVKEGIPRVVEYNIRFGDPECQPLMMMLDTDMVEIAQAAVNHRLNEIEVSWKNCAAATVVLASGGYPADYKKGFTIQGLEEVEENESRVVFHAGTKRDRNRILTSGGRVLGVTCLGDDLQGALKNTYREVDKISWPGVQYRRDIGFKGLKRLNTPKGEIQVAIIMGSASDAPVAEKATKIFKSFDVDYDIIVASAHRTPERTRSFINQSEERGAEVFIAIAGMAAHLPGVVAADTQRPVIGVPAGGKSLGGEDALYSIVQMPPGIPVATVGIDRGDNAALLAIQILGIKYPEFHARHREYRIEMEQKVIQSQQNIESLR
ncbi:MAG: phosphoribosylamine--glycine ligase [Proteobacteria bacterium]|nr:phosphoribosylamine--glycine ligase [Pseudomonadota bacterium]